MSHSSESPFGGPLAGQRILVTRPDDANNAAFLRALQQAGGQVFHLPLIEVATVDFSAPDFQAFDWLFLTSKNAVSALAPYCEALQPDGPDLKTSVRTGVKIACVGPATAQALIPLGLQADFVSPVHEAESAAQLFGEVYPVAGLRIFWPCGNLASPRLKAALTAMGAQVTAVTVYQTVLKTKLTPLERELLLQPWDLMVFTSSSAVEALHQLRLQSDLGFKLPPMACLGPRTTKSALKCFGPVAIQAMPYTLEALSEAIQQFFQNQKEPQ
ncbi:uroporphyrinogen-III synthase [Vampirovibrio sp.]|uniref:uroporphyrinogen-III synthase n=1 Tax=Vampirovibrio sp. TaxID=2717857 RepID=UPI0035939762